MRKAIRRAIQRSAGLAGGAVLVAGLAAQESGCSSPASRESPAGHTAKTDSETGSVAMQLTLPGGSMLSTLRWVVTGPSGDTVQQGVVPLQNSLIASFLVSDLPAPASYVIALTGVTSDGVVSCAGSVQFAVTARSTTNVTDLLRCSAPVGEAGSAMISTLAYDCAAIGSVTETPSEATVGGSVTFTAGATAANPAGVSFAWSAPSGSFSSPNAPRTDFSCTSAGTVAVTLTVGDGPVPDGGSCDAALTTRSFQVQCDPNDCGAWTSLTTSPSNGEVYVGETITLAATATGPLPANLGYTWAQARGPDGSTVGVLGTAQDEAAGPSDANTFLCTAPGTTTITVTIDDGPVPDAGVACPTSAATFTKTVTCDPFPTGQVEAAWVELGPGGSPVARALTAATACPSITLNGAAQTMNLRVAAATEPLRTTNSTSLGPQYSKPSVFPVNTCELALPAGTTSAMIAGRPLPLPKANPTKMVVIGDSGCRLKAAAAASASQFQGCNDPTQYPLRQLASLAASLQPDVVLHVGDYQYRENECPPDQANCAGSPWGYGWDTWEADFFQPAADLLAAAPWIVVRGNHEQCTRAGQGWYRFLDPNRYAEAHSCNTAANDAVLQADGTLVGGSYNAPYAVPIGANSQVIVFDSNNVGAAAVTPGGASNFVTYQTELQAAAGFAMSGSVYNIWADHHPVLGFAPNAGAAPSPGNLDLLSVMAATYPGTYFPPNINLALHGHTHLFEALDFTSTSYPATFVTGNAGTLLDVALPDPFPSATVHPDPAGNVTASTIADSTGFGFLFMQYTGGVWVVTEYRLDGSVRSICTVALNGQMTCTVNNFIN